MSRTVRSFTGLGAVLAVLPLAAQDKPAAPAAPASAPRILAGNLKTHVEFLASDALGGRNDGSDGNAEAAKYLQEWLTTFGVQAGGPGGEWMQPFEEQLLGHPVRGANLVGKLPGSDPELAKEVVLIEAHHDHLGERYGKIYNGADDDASGCALLLELARVLGERKERPRRTICFVSFDAEEDGLVGSRYFARSGLVDPKTITTMIGFDLIGGDFYPGCEKRVFALGAEHSPALAAGLERWGRGLDLEVRRFGIYLIEPFGRLFPRSDYGPFRDAGVPFLFFTTGTPWYYHTVQDDPERINYAKMERIGLMCLRMVEDLAGGSAAGSVPEDRPKFEPSPAPDLEDARGVLEACRDLLERHQALKLEAEPLDRLQQYAGELREMIERGRFAAEEQRRIQAILMDVLGIVAQTGPR